MRDPEAPFFRNEVTTNRYVWIAIGIGVVLTLAAAYLPVLSDVLGTVPPSGEGWLLIAAGSLVPLIVGQVAKLGFVRRLLAGRKGRLSIAPRGHSAALSCSSVFSAPTRACSRSPARCGPA